MAQVRTEKSGGRLIGLLRLVPVWAWALVAALLYGGWQHHRATAAGIQALEAQKALATLQADAAKHSIDTLARTVAVQQEAVHAAQETATADRAAADAAAGALVRLRNRAAHPGGGCAAPAVASGSTPTTAGAVVPAELLGEVGELARRYAAIADDRGRAGAACERIGSQQVTGK